MKKIITIKWEGYKDTHEIVLTKDGYAGFCRTHNEYVSMYKRCSHFPPQTAMWHDLWAKQSI